MKEIIIVAIVLFLYFILSYIVYNKLIKSKTITFIALTTAYLVFTYLLFLGMLRLAAYQLTTNLYDDSIHVNEIMLAAFFVCSLTAFVNIIAAIARIENGRKIHQKDNSQIISKISQMNGNIAEPSMSAAQ